MIRNTQSVTGIARWLPIRQLVVVVVALAVITSIPANVAAAGNISDDFEDGDSDHGYVSSSDSTKPSIKSKSLYGSKSYYIEGDTWTYEDSGINDAGWYLNTTYQVYGQTNDIFISGSGGQVNIDWDDQHLDIVFEKNGSALKSVQINEYDNDNSGNYDPDKWFHITVQSIHNQSGRYLKVTANNASADPGGESSYDKVIEYPSKFPDWSGGRIDIGDSYGGGHFMYLDQYTFRTSAKGRQSISGQVTTQDGAPVSNATVRFTAYNHDELKQKYSSLQAGLEDLNETINHPVPDSWKPSQFPQVGTSQFKQQVVGDASQTANEYVAVHDPADWDVEGNGPRLGRPTIHPTDSDGRSTIPVALSVWDPDGAEILSGRFIQDTATGDLLGVIRDDKDIVIKEVGPRGSVLNVSTVTTQKTIKTGRTTNAHDYALVRLSPGVYRIHPEGAPTTAYTIVAGKISNIRAPQTLKDKYQRKSKHANKIADLLNNNKATRFTTTTGPNGKFDISVPNAFGSGVVTAYKVPSNLNVSGKVTAANITQAYRTNPDYNGTVYLPAGRQYSEIPASNVTVRVQEGLPRGLGHDRASSVVAQAFEFFRQVDRLSTPDELNSTTIRNAIHQHQQLRHQVVENNRVKQTFCQLPTVDCQRDSGVGALTKWRLSDVSNVNTTELHTIQQENAMMVEAIRRTPATLDTPSAPLGSITSQIPDAISKTIPLPFKATDLSDIRVVAVYPSGTEELPDSVLELRQHYGGDGGQSAVVVKEWSPENGRPVDWRVVPETPTSGSESEDARPSAIYNQTISTNYNLSKATQITVGAQLNDGQIRPVTAAYWSVNDSLSNNLDIRGWPVPSGRSVDSILVDVEGQAATNSTNDSVPQNTLSTTITVDQDLSKDKWKLTKTVAVFDSGNVTIDSQYVSASGTTVEVNSWPVPKQETVKTVVPRITKTNDPTDAISSGEYQTLQGSFKITEWDLTTARGPTKVRVVYRDGSKDTLTAEYWSEANADRVDVSGYKLPADKSPYRFVYWANVSGGVDHSVSDSDGSLSVDFDTGYSITQTTPPASNTFHVGALYVNFSDGTATSLSDSEWSVTNSGQNVTISSYSYDGSKTVTNVHVVLQDPEPDGTTGSISAAQTLETSYTSGLDVSATGNYTVDGVFVHYKDGDRDRVGAKYWYIESPSTIHITGYPVEDGKEFQHAEYNIGVDPDNSKKSVNYDPQRQLLNSTVTASVNLSKSKYVLNGVDVTYVTSDGVTKTTAVDPGYWYKTGDKTVTITSWPVPAGAKTVTDKTIVWRVSEDAATSSVTAAGDTITKEIPLAAKADSLDEVTVTAKFQDGSTTIIQNSHLTLGPYGSKVVVDSWPVPDGKTISGLSAVVGSSSADKVADATGATSDAVLNQTVSLSTNVTASQITVNAVYDNGSSDVIATSYWSVNNNRTVAINDWPIPDGASVDDVQVEIAEVGNVSVNATQTRWLSMSVPFDGDVTGSDLNESDVSVLVHFTSGATTTMDPVFWSVNDNLARDDEVVIDSWPIPQDQRVENVEILTVTGEGVGTYTRSPSAASKWGYSGQVPEVASVTANTQFPTPGSAVRLRVTPETPSTFTLTDVDITGPNGSTVDASRPSETTIQFVPNTAGDHQVTYRYENAANETFAETVTIDVQDTSRPAPPTFRAERGIGGLYPVVSDGLVGGDIQKAEDGALSVEPQLAASQGTPEAIDVHLSQARTATSAPVTVDLVRGADEQAVKQSTTVRLHVARLSPEAHVWVDGEPLEPAEMAGYSIERSDNGATIVTKSGPDGEVKVDINQHPGLIDQARFLIASIDLPFVGGFLGGVGALFGGGGGVAAFGLIIVRRRTRGDQL